MRKRKRGETRLYLVSDFHASDRAWKKMLNAVRLNLYGADAVLYCGDLTGKAMVPIVSGQDGWTADLLGTRRTARTERELEDLERDVSAIGYYPHRTTSEEIGKVGTDPTALAALFESKIREQVADWMTLAADRLGGTGVPVYLIPGNDDPYEIDEPLAASEYCQNVDGRVVDIPGELQVLGMGKSNPTPWDTPREVSDDDFQEELHSLAQQASNLRRTIFLIHCPPYGTGIDTAPVLDASLRLQASAGDLLRGPVGSTGVLAAERTLQPLLGLHGHIHESAGERKLGETLLINPGSEAAYGIVRGQIIDVSSSGVERTFRVEG